MAQKKFFSLERRFAKDKVLESEYKEFMQLTTTELLNAAHQPTTCCIR